MYLSIHCAHTHTALSVTIHSTSPQVVRLSESLFLHCSSISPRTLTYRWMLNTTDIAADDTHIITGDGSSSNLTVTLLTEQDLGCYMCIAVDDLNTLANATVTVTETQELYFNGGNVTRRPNITRRDVLRLECPIRGGQMTPSVRWFRMTKELYNGTDGVIIDSLPSGSSVLVDAGVTAGDVFTYSCTASDGMDHIRLDFQVTIVGESSAVATDCIHAVCCLYWAV